MRSLADTRKQQSSSSRAPRSLNVGVPRATERPGHERGKRRAPIVSALGVMVIAAIVLLGGAPRPLPSQAHLARALTVDMIVATSAPTPMTPCPGGGTPCP